MIRKMFSFIHNCCVIFKIIFPGLLFFFGPAIRSYSQTKPDSVAYRFYPLRISQDFDISASLANPVWKRAQAIYIRHEIQPNDQVLAPVKTKVKVLYSDHYLYIGFWAHDPHPSKIRAHITDRDGFFGDDYVGIFLDPFKSNQYAYELFVNPKGIQLDAKRSPNSENGNFDMLWFSEGAVNDSGYTAVMKIPFKSFHFPDKKVQDWSVQFYRTYPRDSRYELSWTNFSLGNSCLLCQNGRMLGMTGIKSSNPVNIIPYALGYHSSSLDDPGDPASGLNSAPVDGRIGATITYSPTSTSSLDATINPDFSQIETDATQISVNKTFAIQYAEKRSFFLNRTNLFHPGYSLFYSRTINRPWAAAKYTQTGHHYSVAYITAYDRNTPFIVPGRLESATVASGVNAYDNILRSKFNIGSQSYVGGLVTTRNEAGAHNYVGSVDWHFFLGHHFYFSGNAAYSSTKELNDTTLFNDPRRFGRSQYDAAFNGQQYGGTNFNLDFSRHAKYYSFRLHYNSLAPTFQAQNGFITNTDRRQIEGSQEFNYYPNNKWLSKGGVFINGSWNYDFAGAFKNRSINVGWFNHFPGQTQFEIQYLLLNDATFRRRFFTKLHHLDFSLNSKPSKLLSFNADFQTGRFIYRTLNPELGHGYNLLAGATIKPMPRLQVGLNYSYSTLSSLDDQTKFYSGSISRMEVHYNFSRHLFFRLIGQYNSFSGQIQVYPLLYYKLNPFTKIYLGMTDNLQHVNRFGPPKINGYRQINREFFIKIQYLIRK